MRTALFVFNAHIDVNRTLAHPGIMEYLSNALSTNALTANNLLRIRVFPNKIAGTKYVFLFAHFTQFISKL